MNTNIIRLEKPYDIIMCDGELHEHIATLIVSTMTSKSPREVYTVSYPIFEDGCVHDKPMDCVTVVAKRGNGISCQEFEHIKNEFIKNFPYSDLSGLFNDLMRFEIHYTKRR